jgi:hypothetical protein
LFISLEKNKLLYQQLLEIIGNILQSDSIEGIENYETSQESNRMLLKRAKNNAQKY